MLHEEKNNVASYFAPMKISPKKITGIFLGIKITLDTCHMLSESINNMFNLSLQKKKK